MACSSALVRREMQTALSGIWIRVAPFISLDDSRYTKLSSQIMFINGDVLLNFVCQKCIRVCCGMNVCMGLGNICVLCEREKISIQSNG